MPTALDGGVGKLCVRSTLGRPPAVWATGETNTPLTACPWMLAAMRASFLRRSMAASVFCALPARLEAPLGLLGW
jgi:hypothetical protein